MNTPLTRLTTLRTGAVIWCLVLLGGCLKERLTWSPDGRHAAVITADGLHLADPDGNISPLLSPRVYRAAWLRDSEHLVLARTRPVKTFAEVAAALGPDRTRALVAKAENVGRSLKERPRTKETEKLLAEELGADAWGVLAYLREQPAQLATLRAHLGAEWKREDESAPVELHEVVIVRRTGPAALKEGPVLHLGLPEVLSLRPDPGARIVVFATKAELSTAPDHGIRLLVVPVNASAPATVVATQSSAHPDWTPDSRSLVFFKASGNVGTADDLRLGALVERPVLDSHGVIAPSDEFTELAGLLFHEASRVRCLRDGRLLFNASPVSLPTTGSKHSDREHLFLLSRTEGAALRSVIPPAQLDPLPTQLSVFEVSPDESQIMITSDKAGVFLLTLASGAVAQVAPPLESNKDRGEGENYPAPAWRGAGEITFLRRAAPSPGQTGAAAFELVLRRGPADTVLSRAWDAALLRRLIE